MFQLKGFTTVVFRSLEHLLYSAAYFASRAGKLKIRILYELGIGSFVSAFAFQCLITFFGILFICYHLHFI